MLFPMFWLIGGVVAGGMVVMLLFALALGRASRNVKPVDDRTIALTELTDVKSPSGKPFYPEENSFWDLAQTLDDVDPPPRGS